MSDFHMEGSLMKEKPQSQSRGGGQINQWGHSLKAGFSLLPQTSSVDLPPIPTTAQEWKK